jgi:putative GTP pyrophosphokinase
VTSPSHHLAASRRVPAATRRRVDAAGEILRRGGSSEELDSSYSVLSQWRASHAFPLNTIAMVLRSKVKQAGVVGLYAQRLKRTPAVVEKLRRFSSMQLSQMQDIGGCRVVLRDVESVRAVRARYDVGWSRHELTNEKNYINEPKASGYRSHHLVFRYQSPAGNPYDGRLIEVQIRSQIQHAWATAVEVAAVVLSQPLKSSIGSDVWLRFFTLASSLFADIERTPSVPGTPSGQELVTAISSLQTQLRVIDILREYNRALHEIPERAMSGAQAFLLTLSPSRRQLRITPFAKRSLARHAGRYLQTELALDAAAGEQAVLVNARSLKELRRAYPNYFLDTGFFLTYLRAAVAGRRILLTQ